VVLPMTLTAAVSYGLRRLLLSQSIYTMKLARRGHRVPEALQANANLVHHVSEIRLAPVTVLPAEAPVSTLPETGGPAPGRYIVAVRNGQVTGVLSPDWLTGHRARLAQGGTLEGLAALAGERCVAIPADRTVFKLLARMQAARASVAVVLGPPDGADAPPRVLGLVTMAHLAELIAEGMELFEE
jgi:chloride channel protein, CIC family